MIGLNIFTDFCSWWWLAWLLPFILGLLLGRILWGKWARIARELEDDMARTKSNLNITQTENKTLKSNQTRSERELSNCEDRYNELKLKFDSLKSKQAQATQDLKLAAAAPPLPSSPSEDDKAKDDENKFSVIKKSNLQIIEGIGPVMETVLQKNGIKKWGQLASKSIGELKAILDLYGDKYKIIDPSDWSIQANLANRGDWEGLISHQKADGSESKAEKLFDKLGLI